MTLCNNFQRKWEVGLFSGVGVFREAMVCRQVLRVDNVGEKMHIEVIDTDGENRQAIDQRSQVTGEMVEQQTGDRSQDRWMN